VRKTSKDNHMNILELLNEEDVSSAGSFNAMIKAIKTNDPIIAQRKANKLVRQFYARKEGKGANPHTVANLKNRLAMIIFGYVNKKNNKAKSNYNNTVKELNKLLENTSIEHQLNSFYDELNE